MKNQHHQQPLFMIYSITRNYRLADLGLENDMRRGRSRGVESGGAWTRGREPDERKPEALAAEKIDLEREPRQAISSGGLRFLLRWFGRRTSRESKRVLLRVFHFSGG